MTNTRTRTVRLLCAAALLSGPLIAGAQQLDAPAAPAPGTPLFRSESELVVMHVTVRDRDGTYVRGLQAPAFQLLENGRPRAISLFAAQGGPATIGLIIDVSGSMEAAGAAG